MTSAPKILLAEDDLVLLLDMQDRLERLGCHVVGPAGSVDKAQQVLDCESPDAAVLDVVLKGQSVAPIARRLLSQNIPCLLVTAYTRESISDETLARLPRLQKPVRDAMLKQALEDLLR